MKNLGTVMTLQGSVLKAMIKLQDLPRMEETHGLGTGTQKGLLEN